MQRAEDIILGLAVEETRNTFAAPQVFLPARVPAGIKTVEKKVLVKETRASKMDSSGSEIVESHAEGPVEFNVRCESIGFLLLSLMGKCTTTPRVGQTGVYDHAFEVLLGDPEHPTLSAALSQPAVQDYEYPGTLVSPVKFTLSPSDLLKAVCTLMAQKEDEAGDPFDVTALDAQLATDVYFRHYNSTVKLASAVGGLGAASAKRTMELDFDIAHNGRPDQAANELNPNMIAGRMTAGGKIKINFEDTTDYDLFKAGTKRAMSISFERADVNIAATSIHPSITFTFPNVTFENVDFDRPIEDIVTEAIDWAAHYDGTAGYGIKVDLVNGRDGYVADGS